MSSRRILVFPYWDGNPYQDILYLAAKSRGVRIVKTTSVDTLASQASLSGDGDVIHVHWTAPVCQEAPNRREAEHRLQQFKDVVVSAKNRGVRLVWTIHNVLAHESPFEDLEIELCAWLGSVADLILAINPRTREYVAESYDLPPEKTVLLRHSSYRGWYDEAGTKIAARKKLGVSTDARAVLLFGHIRPYKGAIELIDACKLAAQIDPRVTLLLAGSTLASEKQAVQDALADPALKSVSKLHYISPYQAPDWFKAADLAVIPYRASLNSGSLHMASSFGTKCLVPDQAPLRTVFGDERWVEFYHSDAKIQELAYSIISAFDDAEKASTDATMFARQYTPYMMSSDYADILESIAS